MILYETNMGGIIMKKLLLIGMLVISGLSFGRDFEVREREELKVVHEPVEMDRDMLSREREASENNFEKYSDFHRDLENLDRRSDKR